MKIVKTANGKQRILMSKSEWVEMGKKAGWYKKAQELDFNDFGNIENLDLDESLEVEPEDTLHDDELKREVDNESKAWFEVIVESEDLNVDGRPDVDGLANRLYEVIQGAKASGLEDKGAFKRDLYTTAQDWLSDEDRNGTVSLYDEIPSFHFKSLAQRLYTLTMDRTMLD